MLLGNDDLRNLARKAGMDRHPGVKALVNAPMLPAKKRQRLVKWLTGAAAINCPEPHPLVPGPGREEAGAGIAEAGLVVTGRGPEYPFRFSEEHFLTHMQIDASTGGGKSLTLINLGLQVHKAGIPVWWFDSEGDICAAVVAEAPDVMVINYKDIRLALFDGPEVEDLDWGEYLNKLVHSFQDVLLALHGMQNMIRDVALELREKQGPFTIYDFYQALLSRRYKLNTRERGYFDSLKNRFQGMIIPFLGKTYGSGSHDIRALMTKSIVWQLQGLSEDVLDLFITVLFVWIGLVRQAVSSPALGLLAALDEAVRIFTPEWGKFAQPQKSAKLDFMATCRKRQAGVMLATQFPHLLPKQVAALTNSWVVFRPADGYFLDCVSEALDLDRDQQEYLMRLPDRHPRRVIIRCPGVADPFLVELPELDFGMAGQEEIRTRRQESLRWLEKIYAPRTVRERTAPLFGDRGQETDPVPREHVISKARLDYLILCAQEQFTYVTVRDKGHGIPTGTGTAYRRQLAEEGLLKLHRIETGKSGGQPQLTEVTEDGYRLLGRYQVSVSRPPGRGSYQHKWWQRKIWEWATRKMGYPAVIEQEVAGKSVDVGVRWEERRVAVEVCETGVEKELSNIEKDLAAGWDQVVLCAVRQETLDRLHEKILDELGNDLLKRDRVRLVRLSDFLTPEGEKENGSAGKASEDSEAEGTTGGV